MRKCPSCGEKVADGLEICKACGYDFTDRSGHRGKAVSGGWIMPAIVVLVVALVIVVVLSVRNRKPATQVDTWPMRQAARATTDSVPAGGAQSSAGHQDDAVGKAHALIADYNTKINDIQQQAEDRRKRLKDAGRLTPQLDDRLNQIVGRCGEARGSLATLGGAPSPEMRKAWTTVMDSKLADIRRLFGQVNP